MTLNFTDFSKNNKPDKHQDSVQTPNYEKVHKLPKNHIYLKKYLGLTINKLISALAILFHYR
jgi:hypothetical protein